MPTQPEAAVVLCVDEKSGMQALDRAQPVLPGMPERATHNCVRRGTTSLFAAFNIADSTLPFPRRRCRVWTPNSAGRVRSASSPGTE